MLNVQHQFQWVCHGFSLFLTNLQFCPFVKPQLAIIFKTSLVYCNASLSFTTLDSSSLLSTTNGFISMERRTSSIYFVVHLAFFHPCDLFLSHLHCKFWKKNVTLSSVTVIITTKFYTVDVGLKHRNWVHIHMWLLTNATLCTLGCNVTLFQRLSLSPPTKSPLQYHTLLVYVS